MIKEGVPSKCRPAPAAGRNLLRHWRISLLVAVYLVLPGCWTVTADTAAYVRQAVVGAAAPPSASPLRPPTSYANTLLPWTHSCQVTLVGGGSSSSSGEGHQTSLPAPPRVAAIKCWAAAEPPGNDDSPLPVRLRLGSALAAHISNSSLLSSGFVIVAQSRDRMAPATAAIDHDGDGDGDEVVGSSDGIGSSGGGDGGAIIFEGSEGGGGGLDISIDPPFPDNTPIDIIPTDDVAVDLPPIIVSVPFRHLTLLVGSDLAKSDSSGNSSGSDTDDMDDRDDWGITFLAVPHLRLVDSVVSDLPLSSVAPLLQCLNCTYLSIHNTTLTQLHGVAVGNMTNVTSTPQRDVYGAVHATRVLEVSIQNSTCSGVRDSHGFACLYLQQQGSLPSFHIINSTFENNSVVWPSTALGLSCERFWPFEVDKLGLGVIVTAPYDSSPSLLQAAGSANRVQIQGSRFNGNTGGCGGVFAFLNTSTETSTLKWETSSAAGNRADGYGGVVAWLAEEPLLSAVNTDVSFTLGSNITLNSAGRQGGTVFSDRSITFSNLTVADNSHLTLNHASLAGGAVFCAGIIANLTVAYSSTLSNNTSLGGEGGAVSCSKVGNMTVYSKSQVSSNTASLSGGALSSISIGHVLVAEDSELSHNTAAQDGGVFASSSTFSSLSVRMQSRVSYNTAQGHGGVVSTYWPVKELIDISYHSEMSYNVAGGVGGITYGSLDAPITAPQVTITNYSRISKNRASSGCGAMHSAKFSVIVISASTISGNEVNFDGGGVICSPSGIDSLHVWASNITDNKGTTGGFIDTSVIQTAIIGGGSRIENNQAVDQGGAFSAWYIQSLILTEGSSISNNHATSTGGAISLRTYYMGPSGQPLMNPGTFSSSLALMAGSRMNGNSALNSGGAIYVEGGLDLQLFDSSEVSRNSARVEGGAVFCLWDCSVALLNGSTMEGNSAGYGGALVMSTGRANITITHNSSVSYNSAAVSGGAVYIRTAPAYVSLSLSSRLDNNTAKGFGGALACEQGLEMLLIQSGSSCSGNMAEEGGGCLHAAGVVYNVTIALRSRLDANGVSENVGGALHVGNLPYLALTGGSSCADNWAIRGGAIYVMGTLGYATIAASSFSGNNASVSGGALQAAAVGTLQLLDGAVVSGNSGASQGGFLLTQVISNLTIANGSTIRGNSAGRGGAVYVAQRMVSLTVASSEMSGNSATDDGGVIYLAAAASGSSGSSRVDSGPSVWAIHGSFLGGNTAGRHGGVIFFEGSEQVGPVPPSPPINVPAAGSGGSITTHGSPASPATPAAALLLDLSGSQLVGNSAGQLGGALALASCRRVLISGGSFQNNVASQSGGGVAAWGLTVAPITVAAATEDGSMQQQRLLLVNGSEFVGNSAARGGGLYAGPHSAIVCDGCSFRVNAAWEAGAAVAGERCGLLALLRCTVANGSSCGDGGGVSSVGCGRTHLEACAITANRAARGAGVYLAPAISATAPELAPAHGAAAVATGYHTAVLSNANFVGNRAERRSAVPVSDVRTTGLGGAVFVEDGFHRVYGVNVSLGGNAAWLGAGVASLQHCPPLSFSHTVPDSTLVDLPPRLPTWIEGFSSSSVASTARHQQPPQQDEQQQLQQQYDPICSLLVLDTRTTASLLWPPPLPALEVQQGAAEWQIVPAVPPLSCTAQGGTMEVLSYPARSAYFEDGNLTALLTECDAVSGSHTLACTRVGRSAEVAGAATATAVELAWVEHPPAQVLPQDADLCSYTPGGIPMDGRAAATAATAFLLRTTTIKAHHGGNSSYGSSAMVDGPTAALAACRMASVKSGAVLSLGLQLLDMSGRAVSSVPEAAAYTVTLTLLATAVNDSTSTQELLLLEINSSYSSRGGGVTASDTSYACQPQPPPTAGTLADRATSQPCNPNLSVAFLSSDGPPSTGLEASGFGGVSAQINISNGVAAWDRLQLTGYPGIYTLVVRVNGPHQVAPVFIPVQLLGCDVGESLEAAAAAPTAGSVGLLSDMVRARCVRCPRRQVGVVPDPRPPLSALLQAPNALREILTGSAHACRACPSHAACTGGPVVVPLLGYWHSAPGSLQLHRCPFAGACSAGYAEAPLLHGDGGGSSAGKIAILAALDADVVASVNSTLAALGLLGVRTLHLASCQQGWYAAGSAIPATLSDDTTLSRQPPAVVTFNGSSSSISSSSSTNTRTSSESVSRRANSTTAAAASLACCVLHGLPPDHPRSYVQQQCAEGYTGNLCAACQPGWTRGLDFQCNACSSLAQTIGLGLLAFVATAAVVLYISVSNFEGTADAAAAGGDPVVGGPPVGDILKVVVLHLQYFIIITRLDLGQPSIVPGLTGIMAALTGAEFYFAYSHACLLPNQDSAGQAFLTLMGSLVTPCAIVVACLLLWALRYHCMHRGRRRRAPVPLNSSLDGLTCAHSLAAMELILDTPRSQQLPETPKRQQPVSPSAQHKHVLRQDVVVFLMSADDCKTAAAAAERPCDPGSKQMRMLTCAQSSQLLAGSSTRRMLAAGATHVQRLARGSSVLSSSLSALRNVDRTLGLPQQLGIVLLVSVFVLYPTWAQAAFSVFSCYIIDRTDVRHRGSLPDLQVQAAHPHGYWVRNMNQECYSGLHASLYVPIGITSLLVFCAAPPVVTFVLLYRTRHRLKEPHTQQVYGFMYSRYRPRYYWYDSAIQLQTLALVAVDVFGRAVLVQYQALMLLVVLSFISSVNAFLAPVRSRLLRQLELSSSGVLILTISLSLYFVVGDDDTALMDGPAGDAIAYLILLLNIALLSTFLCVVLHRSWPTIRGWAASAAACCCPGRSHSGGMNSSGSNGSASCGVSSSGNSSGSGLPALAVGGVLCLNTNTAAASESSIAEDSFNSSI